MRIVVQDIPRSVDDLILAALKDRQRGVRVGWIAKKLGVSPSYISKATQIVKLADQKECKFWGDNPKKIMGAYW